MSVRRLATEEYQPQSFSFTEENEAWAQATIAKYPPGKQQSAVILLLMRAQEQEGWVTRPAIEYVANMLSMPYIRALEIATFYTQFQLKPVGTKAHIQICGTTPCMLRGSEELIKICQRKINALPQETNASGTLSWEEVECLGACVNAPVIMVFKDRYEDLTAERFEEILQAFEEGRGDEIPVGPQNGRVSSEPLNGLTSLTNANANVSENSSSGQDEMEEAEASKKEQQEAHSTFKQTSPTNSSAAKPMKPTKAARENPHTLIGAPAIKNPKQMREDERQED